MNAVQVQQKSYEMPPRRVHRRIFLSRGDSSGAPGYIQIANMWLLSTSGAGRPPTSRR